MSPVATLNLTQQQALANDRDWLALLHMQPHILGGYSSYVDDPAFFLSALGQTDPLAELTATLSRFSRDPKSQCQFVGRRNWLLSKYSAVDLGFTVESCPDYQAWRQQLDTQQVVLVFASSYINSPSSMYGHTFLRFDPPNLQQGSPLLSYALNFGAIVGPSDTGMLYAFRGIAGGYPGQFSAQRYYEKVKEYSRLDNRDLWEYHLNLTAPEIDRMLAHIWELNHINFDYYFFDENCSYRLLELLDVARPGHDLSRQFSVFAIPIDTVRAVQQAGMIAKVDYRASNGTRHAYSNDQLTPANRRLTQRLVEDETLLTAPEFVSQDEIQQRLMIDVSYGYLRDLQDDSGRDTAVAKRRYALLKAKNSLPAAAKTEDLIPVPTPPDEGHHSSHWGIRGGQVGQQGLMDLEARIAYHDLLDNLDGYTPGSTLNMGRMVIRQQEGESLAIEQVDVIGITSLTPGDQLNQPLSWQVDSGGRRLRVEGDDSWLSYLNGGVGHTYHLGGQLNGYGLLRAQLEYTDYYQHNLDLALGASLGLLLQSARHNLQLEASYWQFSQPRDRQQLRLGYQYALSTNLGLRLEASHLLEDGDEINEISLGLRHYF